MTDQAAIPLYMAREGLAPSAEASALRDSGRLLKVPVTLGSGEAWLVTRYADVREVLSDPTRFSNALSAAAAAPLSIGLSDEERARRRKGQLLAFDPPEHTRLRRILAPEFTMRRMRVLEPRIAEIVDAQLDELERLGPGADFMAAFALPVPSLVICELLGVPAGDRSEFQERTSRLLDMSRPREERAQVGRESDTYMRGLVARALADPGEDILGMLIREHRDELDADALTNIAGMLLTAGHETTANMLALGTLALLTSPGELAALRAGLDDAEQVEAAVEELLRFLSVAHSGIPRAAVRDVEIAGQLISAGDQVLFALAPANRDPDFVEDGDRLDVSRKPTPHVAFGHGPHHCLGAPLARAEMALAFPALLRRFPDLALAVPPEEIRFRPFHVVYGVETLPLTWTRTTGAGTDPQPR
ncbi:cytochrome P450 [Sphaerisporangium sp. NPDC005288]|uniref:cytochrome P450 n=1 Tax=Sphaerisporangium sp. NPDC005288 TaxID=3155114 RepID=UPI0033B1E369